jgi:hypothetical protein
MITKLTLILEQEVVKPAKIYARKKGRSLSELIENYLKAIISKKTNSDDLSLRVKRLIGSVNLKEDFDYKKTLEEQIVKRYSK